MKKLFSLLTICSSASSVIASVPTRLAPFATTHSRHETYSLPNTPPSRETPSTPRNSRRPSLSLSIPSKPARTTTGFNIAPMTPPSSTATSPLTPTASPTKSSKTTELSPALTPTSATERTWEDIQKTFQEAVEAYNLQQKKIRKKRLPIQNDDDRSALSPGTLYMPWMSEEEEARTLEILERNIGEQL